MIYLGIKGNQLAFKKSDLASVKEFNKIQKVWEKWTLIILLLSLGVAILKIIL